MSWTMILLFAAGIYLALIVSLLVLIARKRRRRQRAWQDWHSRQGAKVSAWRRLFGRSGLKQLPHFPKTEEASDPSR